MRTFILLSTLSPQGIQTLRATPERLLEVNREVEALGGRVLDQWAVLGAYDFMSVVEAPDERAMTQISAELAARGSAHFEVLPALAIEDFIKSLD
ncbi:MAG: GYD domain-containing protein [Thermoleophilia bacterium]